MKAFIVVFSDPKHQDLYQTFHYFWEFLFITDVIAISYGRQEPCVDIYSYQPFTRTSCRVVTVSKIHEICKNSSNTQLKVFPRMIKNFHKCEIRGSASTGEIYNTLKTPFYEENCLKELSIVLNFTFKIERKNIKVDIEKFDFTNFDIVYGSNMLTEDRMKIMSYSYPHSPKSLYMFLKNERNYRTSLEILLEPFNWTMWLALIVSSVIGTILLAIRKQSSIIEESLTMLCMLLGISAKLSSNHFAVRIQYFCWLFLGLMISTIHHAIFFDILKFDLLQPLPRTLQDVVETNFVQAIMVPEPIGEKMTEYLRRFTDMEIIIERVNGIVPALLHGKQKLLAITTRTVMAFSSEEMNSFHILEDELSTIFTALYFQKNSFLVKSFNKFSMEIHCSGILRKWREDFYGELSMNREIVDHVKALSMRELLGIFEVWAILLLLSCGIFVAEIVYFIIVKNKYYG